MTGGLWGQASYTVRLASGASDLESWFREVDRRGILPADLDPALRGRYPFLADLSRVEALLPPAYGPAPAVLRGYYVLGGDFDLTDLLGSGAFEEVEPSRTYRLHEAEALAYQPNDDSLSRQWYIPYIGADRAWDLTRGRSDIRIGVVDTGLDYGHPELDGQIAINTLEDLNGNGRFEPWPVSEVRHGLSGDFDGLDNDGNGYADDVIGYDFVDQPRSPFGGDYLNPDPNPLDDNSHGTVVSGVIVARMDNRLGGAGIAPDCRVMVLRAFGADGAGEDDDIARAIVYATDQGVRILNFSFGDIYPSSLMHAAIQYAHSQGVIMIASAGNATGDALHYPSSYPEVISVSATAADLATGREYLWPLSSYGLTVDLAAPGSQIFTTTLRDTAADGQVTAYTRTQGTSLSAPMVSAAVGLLFAHRGPRTPGQVRGILSTSADDVSEPGWDHLTGGGRLNIFRALQVVGNPEVQLLRPANDSGSARDTVWIVGTVLDPELTAYALEFQAGTTDETPWQTILEGGRYQTIADTLGMWDLSGLEEGDYTLRLRVTRSNGFTLEDRLRFVRDQSPPEIEIRRATSIWDNEQRAWMLVYRASDPATVSLHYRPVGGTTFRQRVYDRRTRNGEFLLAGTDLGAGDWEYYLRAENLAGLVTETPLATFSFSPTYINREGYREKPYLLAPGRVLPQAYDLDGDGLQEVIMSRYQQNFSPGKVMWYEYAGGQFLLLDSVAEKNVLLTRDVGDVDGDGLWELLVSVNDSLLVLEQSEAGLLPDVERYRNEGNERYPAGFRDTDGDGSPELVLKDFEDYYIYDWTGSTFEEVATLPDVSPDYAGANAPRAVTADLDGDGRPETAYQDFDGDLMLYEHVSGQNYALRLLDTTDLIREEAGSYLVTGDFDGDGQPELFSALHTSLPTRRNEDFEYDAAYWWLRIWKSSANDTYDLVWEDFVYDFDTRDLNAATTGNLDQDPAQEILFSSYPRTYLIDFQGGTYGMEWFLYGLATDQHLIADFDGNGLAEFSLSRGDSILFFEKDLAFTGPKGVYDLSGQVLGPNTVRLSWPASPNASGYEVWRVTDPFNNGPVARTDPMPGTSFTDASLTAGTWYAYVIRAVNPALNPDTSDFGNFVFLRPHARPRVDSAAAVGPRQVEVWFSEPVWDAQEDRDHFVLNDTQSPVGLVGHGDPGHKLLLSFSRPMAAGPQTLTVDTAFMDAGRAPVDPAFNQTTFTYIPGEDETLILSRWERLDDKRATLWFNYPLEESSALDTSHYRLAPYGRMVSVEWGSDDLDAVTIEIADARLGALGYPVSVSVSEVCAINDLCIGETGHTATFSSHMDDLSEVFAYPNPVRNHALFEGMRFANLTQQATVEVFTVSGRFVKRLEETDGDGGLQWDLRDLTGQRVKPGLFIYRVSTEKEGVEDFVGKFSVVE
ncbi:MAG: hypothetical protein D6722_18900 [Bacteroidetes bacterium]|nr:MAG: hypothetical protein D6722_18900 [Bacteroidota bacterium]